MKKLIFALALGLMACAGRDACAKPIMTTLAQQGEWYAGSAPSSPNDSHDRICLAGSNIQPFFVLITLSNLPQYFIGLTDSSWSFPPNSHGIIVVTINNHTYNYLAYAYNGTIDQINTSSSSKIAAQIDQGELINLIGDMETADSLQLKIGSSAPITIPLGESHAVLPAFVTCAGLNNPSPNASSVDPWAPSD